jgi:hypothetical protein
LEDPDVDDRIGLKLILNKSDGGGLDCSCLVQDRDKWWDVLNKIINWTAVMFECCKNFLYVL